VANYSIRVKRSAAKELEAVPLKDRRRLVAQIERLGVDPRPAGYERLSGEQKYRVRQGDYRVVYEILDRDGLVIVVRIGHRREVYR
jgi:mRNA interferase RelE/StbE